MSKEFFAKHVNNKFFHNQDITCQHASKFVVFAFFVKTTGISDMSAQTAALHFSTDLQTQTIVEVTAVVDAAHVILTQLESFQEVACTFKFQKVSSQSAATGSVVASILSSKEVMTSGVTAADDLTLFKIQNSKNR